MGLFFSGRYPLQFLLPFSRGASFFDADNHEDETGEVKARNL